MSLLKILILGIALVFQFTGCLVNEEKTDPIKITSSLNKDTVMTGDTLKLAGTIKAPGKLKITFNVLDSKGASAIGNGQIIPLIDTTIQLQDEVDLSKLVKISTKSSFDEYAINGKGYTCAGNYTLKIEGGIDEGSDQVKGFNSLSLPFTVKGPACDDSSRLVEDLQIVSDTVAGWGSTKYASTFNLEDGKGYKKDAAKAASGEMDLFFNTFSSVSSTSMSIFSIEAAAKTVSELATWSTQNATKFYKSGFGSSSFAKVKSSYIIESQWKEAQVDADGILAIAKGNVIVAKSDLGKITLVNIVDKSGDNSDSYVVVQTLIKK